MSITHKIFVNVTDAAGKKQTVLSGGLAKIPQRLVRFLFGPAAQVIFLNPGQSVSSIVIKEVATNDTRRNS